MLVLFALIVRQPIRGIYLYIFLSSVTLSPYLPIVREKLAISDFIMLMVWISAILRPQLWLERFSALKDSQRVALMVGAAFILVCWISFGVHLIGNNLHGLAVRSALEAFIYTYGFFAALAIVILVQDWKSWINCLVAWCLGATVVASVAMMALTVYSPSWVRDEFTGRISSTLRESGQVASYLGPIVPAMMFLAAGTQAPRHIRPILYATIAPAMIAILATGSRIAFAILCLLIIGLLVLRATHIKRCYINNAAFTALYFGIAFGFGKFFFDVATDSSQKYRPGETSPLERSVRIFSEWGKGSRKIDDSRVDQIVIFGHYFWKHPALGVSPGAYGPRYRIHEIHNSYLATLAEEGVVGFLLLMLWISTVLYNSLRSLASIDYGSRKLIIASVILGFSVLLLYQITTLGLRQRPWWFMAGLMITLPVVVNSRNRQLPSLNHNPNNKTRLSPDRQCSSINS